MCGLHARDGTNGQSVQVGPFETALLGILGEFYTGNVFPIFVGAFGEVNEDASKLITKQARLTAKTDFGKSMSPLVVSHSKKGGAFPLPIMQSQFRRALGWMIARGQAQHLVYLCLLKQKATDGLDCHASSGILVHASTLL